MGANTWAACVVGIGLMTFGSAMGLAQGMAQEAEAKAVTTIHLDAAHTQIRFTAGAVRHIRGTFQLKGGVFAFDSAAGVAQGEILVDAASEKSNSKSLDRKIRKQTLDVDTFPGIVFHPEKESGTLPPAGSEGHIKIEGSLTLRGGDHPLTMDVDVNRTGPDVLIKTAFTVPYVEWGLKDASTFLMHDRNIRITVVSHGMLEAPHS